MYFDFEDYRPEVRPVGSVISWREGILLSIIGHLALIVLMLTSPRWWPADTRAPRVPASILDVQRPQDEARFVFVAPRMDVEALRAPDRAPLSDKDRVARTPETTPKPSSPLPLSRGNTPEPVERVEVDAEPPRSQSPPASPSDSTSAPKLPESQSALALPSSKPAASDSSNRPVPGGTLGDALRNLDRYVKSEQFHNPQGGASFDSFLQFDTKGVDFGRWAVRFKAQVERNWNPLIPEAPMRLGMHGHVVITLNIHKNGSITDVTIVRPSDVSGFNTAAYGALVASNPTVPLPTEYPSDKAFLTVTFFYNEEPPEYR